MSNNEQTGWRIAWNMTQHVNELTQEIISLKERERNNKKEIKSLLHENEILKRKYYYSLADLNQERERRKSSFWKRLFSKKN